MNGATIGRRLSAKASASLRLASACLALPIGRRRSTSLSPRRHPWDNVPFGLPDGFDFGRQGLVSRVLTTPPGSSGNHLLCSISIGFPRLRSSPTAAVSRETVLSLL